MLITAQPGSSRPRGVLPPCRRCGAVDPNRMHALMAFWFSRLSAVPVESGYFYLCPRCYESCIAPYIEELFRRGPVHFTPPDPASAEDLHQ